MLAWFRAQSSRIATVAMVSLAILGASAVTPHVDDCHDSACLSMAVEHDAAAHRIVASSAGDEVHPLHCLVCHWLRSFRPQTEARVLLVSVPETDIVSPIESFAAAMAALAVQPPLRAPPVSPVA